MYTIEYYKTKREKPVPKESGWDRKEVTDVCWNIKSLTIDKEDIEHILYDSRLMNYSHLPGLVAKVRCRSWYKDLEALTILNNNSINQLLIYEIINCEWMINRDEINELDTLKIARNLCRYVKRYDNTNNSYRKVQAEGLLNYYMNTIMNIMNIDKPKQKSEGKILKLGVHIIKPKK